MLIYKKRDIFFKGFKHIPDKNVNQFMQRKTITIKNNLYKGVWIEGYFFKHIKEMICLSEDKTEDNLEYYIYQDGFCDWGFEPQIEKHKIIPETLSVCTGARDIHNKYIFENDIVKFKNEDQKDIIGYIAYSEIRSCFIVMHEGLGFPFDCFIDFHGEHTLKLEVIGNIFENKELIGG